MLGLLLLSAFFSGSEAALFSLTRLQRRTLRERRDRSSQRIRDLLRESNRTLAALLVGNNLVNIALSSIATVFFIQAFGEAGRGRAVRYSTAVVTLSILLFGETMPKVLAVGASLRVARVIAAALGVAIRLLAPITRLFHGSAKAVLRLLRIEEGGPAPAALISRSELHTVLEAVDDDASVITRNESRMVQNILDFSRRKAGQIMTPRVDIDDLDVAASREEIMAVMRESRHSRYPVYRGDPDHIVGFVKGKDYLLNPDRELGDLIRPVLFFPEAATVDRIFGALQDARAAMVIVVNEYGETAGLITREDLIEEIVGDIYDEFDLEDEPIRERGEGKYILPGRAQLVDLNEELELGLPAESAVTLNGFLCEVHGRIPRPGTVVAWRALRFHVLDVARHQVRKVLLEITAREEGGG
jgi:putative hemolysin